MIDYIKGDVAELTPATVTIECGGIGYQMNISLNTYGALNNRQAEKLYVHEVIREDAHVLFGFVDKHERELFLLLITVSGVGPGTARVILSSLSAKELENVIATENAAVLQSVKGIGAKTAKTRSSLPTRAGPYSCLPKPIFPRQAMRPCPHW